tara:strand:- start:844 stop:2004 length:1161 start_codon:yes stop_codon:yes gene_type:complete
MKNRKINLGFVLNYSYNSWVGGFNYHLNLFKSINQFNKKIKIIIFVNNKISSHDQKLLNNYKIIKTDKFNYGFNKNKISKIITKLKIFLFGRDKDLDSFFLKYKIDVLSHFTYLGKNSLIKSIPIIWDFQEIHNPESFSRKDLILRKINTFMCNIHSNKVILGGNHALRDYRKIIGSNKTNGIALSQIYKIDLNLKKKKLLFKKFNLPNKKFFIVPNQYWAHKNHILILKSLKFLDKIKKTNFFIVSTGNTNNWRDQNYFKYIKNYLNKNKIKNYFILGIVSHEDLINLTYYSEGLINPSKSEGWSNSVELAKSLNKINLISKINCHKEQSNELSYLFKINDYKKLSELLIRKYNIKKTSTNKLTNINKKNFNKFGKKYFEIISSI